VQPPSKDIMVGAFRFNNGWQAIGLLFMA